MTAERPRMTATTPLNANLEANVEAKTRLKKCRYSYCSHSKAWIVLAWGVVSVPGLLVNYRFHRLTDSERPSSGFLREPARRRRYKESVVQPAPLSELTQSIRTPCWGVANAFTNETDPMIWIENNERPLDTSKRIPNIIHQTSRARCLYFKFQQLSQPWRDLTTHSYYFHDDAAVWKLIDRHWPEFPNVRHVARCLNSMTAVSDVWRLLVLWQYGGIYRYVCATFVSRAIFQHAALLLPRSACAQCLAFQVIWIHHPIRGLQTLYFQKMMPI
jgi:Glycosyltransferase sugar-binding region containing DXD motif